MERTKEDCKIRADAAARKNNTTYYVVIEGGVYDWCSEFDLETFYCGISENHILYSTDEGWY